jgi:hypothetical protein
MIYVIGTETCWLKRGSSPFVKIGTTIDLRARLAKAQTDFPHELKVHYLFPGYREREAELHAAFAHWHYRGEWFRTWVGTKAIKPHLDTEWLDYEAESIIEKRGVLE